MKELYALLDTPGNDLWYDDICMAARSLVDNSEEQIFELISKEWIIWPENRQEHLAYILGEGSSLAERKLIIELTNSSESAVAIRAREALIEFDGKAYPVDGGQ